MKNISIIGSTGSIGTQTLEVAEHLGNIKICGITADRNIELLEQQIRRFRPSFAAVADEEKAAELKLRVSDTDTRILSGRDGICHVAALPQIEAVVTSIVGIAGLIPTYEAIKAGKDIYLANKETLVTAGDIIMPLAKEHGVKILPVDSEHCAIAQCLTDKAVKRLIITASGGTFFGLSRDEIKDATPEQALKHPNWSMGRKITIDSATLMNKALEVIEAHHLFGVDYDNINVVVHRESIVHSMVEYEDSSVLAQMALPDMRLPIQAALSYPDRVSGITPQLNLTEVGKLTFFEPDTETFPALRLGYRAGREGHSMPTVLNSANEAAVQLFLDGRIGFLQIAEMVEAAMNNHKIIINPSIGDIIELDQQIRGELLC